MTPDVRADWTRALFAVVFAAVGSVIATLIERWVERRRRAGGR